MENHGITMKGKFFMEEVSSPAADPGASDKRVIYNVSGSINGNTDQFGQYKMFFHNDAKWLRPLLANANDGPDITNERQLGSDGYRFRKIWASKTEGFYGAVRYS